MAQWQDNGFFQAAKLMLISAASSTVGAITVYPIDLVKTRMQYQRTGKIEAGTYRNSWHCFQRVLQTEGTLALYRGLIPNLAGQVPEKTVRLFVVDLVRQFVRRHSNSEMLPEITAGAVAGTIQVIITNPAEIIKVNMQIAGQRGESVTAMSLLRSMGIRDLYKGGAACFLRDMPFSGIYFPVYAYCKNLLKPSDGAPHSSFQLLVAGTIAGFFASSTTTPADVIKTRLQAKPLANNGVPYRGLMDCFRRVVAEEGFRALFKGLVPRVLRSAPQYGVMLLSYEILLMALGGVASIPEPSEFGYGKIYKYIVEDKWRRMESWTPPKDFTQGLKKLNRIAVGGQGSVWGLDNEGNVWKWTGFEWKNIMQKLDYLSVGADGAAYGVKDCNIMKFDPWHNRFELLPDVPKARKISVGNQDKVWTIGLDGRPFKIIKGKSFKYRGSNEITMKHISVGADGTVWAIERDTRNIYRWSSDANNWEPIPGVMRVVSVGGKNSVWGVGLDEKLYVWQESSKKWEAKGTVPFASIQQSATGEREASLSVAADGTVIGTLGGNDAIVMHDDTAEHTKIQLSGKSINRQHH